MTPKKYTAVYYRILKYQPENLEHLHKKFKVIELDSPEEDTEVILNKTEILFAPLGYMIDREKIDACPNLKAIVSNTTGHPHIDVEYANEKEIYVACLKFAQNFLKTITPTPELTWGLLISLVRNIIPAHRAVLTGNWDRRPFGAPSMLSNMRLGIVGLGRIGKAIAKYGAAFGMKVCYYDPYVENASTGVKRMDTLGELVQCSDVITVHVPMKRRLKGCLAVLFFLHLNKALIL